MFKIYGVGDEKDAHEIETIEPKIETESQAINVEMREKEDIETDI